MIYYIIGYPVSGKSTFAKNLWKYYNIDVYDLDSVISSKYNKSINELFIEFSEDGFRKIELNTLKEITELNQNKDIVLSTGGGCACRYENMEYMKSNGLVIYLSVSINTIYKRLTNNEEEINKRPRFLKAKKEGNLFEFILEDYEDREYWYKMADIKINYESINNKWPQP